MVFYVNFMYGFKHFMEMHFNIILTKKNIGGLQSQDIYQDELITKSRTIGEHITRKKKNLFQSKKNSEDPGNNLI